MSFVLIAATIIIPWLIKPSQSVSISLHTWIVTSCCLGLYILVMSSRQHSLFRESHNHLNIVTRWAWIFSAVVSSLFAHIQYVGLEQIFSDFISTSPNRIAYANLFQQNLFASLTCIGLAAIYTIDVSKKNLSKLLFTISSMVLLTSANVLTSSRAGSLQFFLIGLTALLVSKRTSNTSPKQLVLASMVLYIVLTILVQYDLTSHYIQSAGLLSRINDSNAYARLFLWSNVYELVDQKPFLGHGWRSLAYMHYSTEFSGARFMEMLDNAHNLPLHLAVELGIPVALGFCGLVLWLIWKNKPWAETRADRQLAWGILMVIGIHSMVEYPLWYGPFFMTAVIAVGILCADGWRAWLLAQTQSVQRAVLWGIRSFAVLLLAGTAFAAFDYHRVSQIYLQPEERSSWYKADPLAAAKKSVLFQSHAKFAELQITPLTRETAPRALELSSELVMWSPEPSIIEKLIESAVMMQVDDLAAFHIKRYKVAYPQAYALWSQRNGYLTSVP
jgi:O-antigen ligase